MEQFCEKMKVMEWVTKSGDKLEVGRLLEKKAAAGIEGLKYHTEWQIRPVLLRERGTGQSSITGRCEMVQNGRVLHLSV